MLRGAVDPLTNACPFRMTGIGLWDIREHDENIQKPEPEGIVIYTSIFRPMNERGSMNRQMERRAMQQSQRSSSIDDVDFNSGGAGVEKFTETEGTSHLTA